MGFLARLLKRNSENESSISRALRAVVEADTPTNSRNLHDALTRQRLILPVPRVPDNLERDASRRLQKHLRLDFLSIQNRNGRKVLAVFTNPEALKKWKSDAPTWIAVDTPSICRMAVASDHSAVRINPGNPDFVELSLEEMRMLAEREAGR
jgi:type III secretion system (T3SS) SseB-like protein